MTHKTKKDQIQKRKDDPQGWSRKRQALIAYSIIMLFYGFYSMIVAIIAYANFQGTVAAYSRIIDNLQQEPIIDLKLSTTNCDSGFDPLFKYDWQGTTNGCNCLNAPNTASYKNLNKQLYSGECNKNQTSAGCSAVLPVQGQEFEKWNINDQSQIVCAQRLKGQKYYKTAPKSASCSSGKKTCGKQGFDNSIYCVDQSQNCPIYSMQISTKSNAALLAQGYEELQLGAAANFVNPNSIYFQRSGEEQPISELRVTEGSGVCQENKKKNIASGHTDYILMKDKRSVCSTTDKRFVELTTGTSKIGEKDYFTVNGVYTQLSSLPQFTTSISNAYTYSQYNRPFLKWDIKERESLEEIVDRKDDVNNMETSQLVIMIINILVCIFVSIILTMMQVYNLMGKDVPCIEGDGEKEQQRIKDIKKGLSYGAKLFQLPFCLWAFILSTKNKVFFKNIADKKPSDDQTNTEFSKLADLIEDDVFKADLQLIVVLIIVILIDVGLYILKLRKRKQKASQQKVQQIVPDNENPENEQQEKEIKVSYQGNQYSSVTQEQPNSQLQLQQQQLQYQQQQQQQLQYQQQQQQQLQYQQQQQQQFQYQQQQQYQYPAGSQVQPGGVYSSQQQQQMPQGNVEQPPQDYIQQPTNQPQQYGVENQPIVEQPPE